MEAYSGFAKVYDLFMDNIPYGEWTEYVKELLAEEGIKDGILLDLGCGTGSVTELLAKAGFDMIGIDNSEEMLDIAMEKRYESGLDILYLLQDMREFELYGTVKGVVSICDSMNYILDDEDLLDVFKLVHNYLDNDGIFIFDMNTMYKYREILADNTFAEDREESSFIWENFYDEEEEINQYDLSLFVQEEDGRYRKYEETHLQRAYEQETVEELLKESGLELLHVYDAFTKEEPAEDAQRIYYVCRRPAR
ncbi:MAG: class I SAM-dependent methyltransferase [Lachnospiraceae bacterium]|nr:class I SAM-dependent methyltransferase [Lachnospiraceae bacterium]MBR5583918.1 class I SAM-dependent methyltransferase [Lachnospiraceae bacterium]